jgi:hypothetical protein
MSQENHQEIKNIASENLLNNNSKTLQQLVDELSYNVRTINGVSDGFVKQFSKAQTGIQDILNAMQETTSKQEEAVAQMITELRILYMIPDKVQSCLDSIAPKIASEVDIIYNSSLNDANQKIELLQEKLNNEFGNYQQKLDEVIHKGVEQLASATENFEVTIEQKLALFTNKLIKSSELASTQNNKKLFKNLTLVVLFSAIVSGITSYVVTTRFPRFVTITGANNLSVHNNSRVEVWNSKQEISTKERSNVRK